MKKLSFIKSLCLSCAEIFATAASAFYAVLNNQPPAYLLQSNKILLRLVEVDKPVAVRYAFTNYPVTNFCHKDGLPAMPFKTDKWTVFASSKTNKK